MARKAKEKKTAKNIESIEQDLEQIRQETIQGGLFFEDKSGDERIRTAIKNKTLKMDEIINAHLTNSKVGAIVSRKSLKSTTKEYEGTYNTSTMSKNVHQKILEKAKQKKAAGLGPGADLLAKKQKLDEKKKAVKLAKGGFDLWDQKEVVDPMAHPEFVAPLLEKKVLRKVSVVKTKQPAVVIAHPGTSYRPTEVDHKAAIDVAAQPEFEKIDKSEKIAQDLSYPPELDDLVDEDFFNDSEVDENEQDEALDGQEQGSERAIKVAKPKTRQEINRKKKLKQKLQTELTIKQQKSLVKQLNMIKQLSQQVGAELQVKKEKSELKKQIREYQREHETKRLSRYKFKPAPMEIQLEEELAQSLRTLKPEGSLVQDRFKSMQARNLIEPRVPVKRKRRYKLKEVESHDYKRFK